jgi:hypothetical protein
MKFEYKFKVPPILMDMTSEWLSAMFLPDPDYPTYQVRTLYFDQLKYEDPNPFRTRIRWYRHCDTETWGRCYAEVKHRNTVGERKKNRFFLGDNLTPHDALNMSGNTVASMTGFTQFRDLKPVLSFQYKRKRYLAPDQSFGINLDTDLELLESWTGKIDEKKFSFYPLPAALEMKTNDSSIFYKINTQFSRFGDQGFSKYLYFYKYLRRQGEFESEQL